MNFDRKEVEVGDTLVIGGVTNASKYEVNEVYNHEHVDVTSKDGNTYSNVRIRQFNSLIKLHIKNWKKVIQNGTKTKARTTEGPIFS